MWRILGRRRRTLGLYILFITCLLDLSVALPVDKPTRFTLSTGDTNLKNIAEEAGSRFAQGRELLGSIADALRIGTGRLVNSVTLTRNIIADRAESFASESRNNVATVIIEKSVALDTTTQYPPVTNTHATARETVRLENEAGQSLLEKPFSKPITGILESFLSPTPLVDGIKEQDKYGNSGDKFIGIGRALVSGFEGFSNFLNAIIDFPRNAAKKTSRGITEALNHVGARLIGLE
ncbi:hypothetical protein ANTQUA_LOCUS4201 [Anthophora quadrimaculata]